MDLSGLSFHVPSTPDWLTSLNFHLKFERTGFHLSSSHDRAFGVSTVLRRRSLAVSGPAVETQGLCHSAFRAPDLCPTGRLGAFITRSRPPPPPRHEANGKGPGVVGYRPNECPSSAWGIPVPLLATSLQERFPSASILLARKVLSVQTGSGISVLWVILRGQEGVPVTPLHPPPAAASGRPPKWRQTPPRPRPPPPLPGGATR